MDDKIIDMGAGLERFSWLTQGTPTAYEAVFGSAINHMVDKCNITYDQDFFKNYSKYSGMLNLDEVSDIEITRKQVAEKLFSSEMSDAMNDLVNQHRKIRRCYERICKSS